MLHIDNIKVIEPLQYIFFQTLEICSKEIATKITDKNIKLNIYVADVYSTQQP